MRMVLKMTRTEMTKRMREMARPPVLAMLDQEVMVSMAVSLVS